MEGDGQDILIGGNVNDGICSLSPFDMSTTTQHSEQDTFVFTMGQGGSMMNMDEIKGWVVVQIRLLSQMTVEILM